MLVSSGLYPYIQAVFFVIFVFFVGFAFNLLFFKRLFSKENVLIQLSFSFVSGSFVLAFLLTFLYYFSLGWLVNFKLYLFLYFLSLLIIVWKSFKAQTPSFPRPKRILVLLILILFFYPLMKESLFSFLYAWDAVGIWFLKAKALFLANSFKDVFLFNSKFNFLYSHKAYPVGLPLIVAFFYRIISSINDQAIKFYYLSFYLSIFLFFLGLFFKKEEKGSLFYIKIFSLFAFFLSPIFILYAYNGYSDLPLSFVFLLLTSLYFEFLTEKKEGRALEIIGLMAIISGFALVIKYEAIPFVLFLWFLLVFGKTARVKRIFRSNPRVFFFLFLGFLPFVLWYLYTKQANLELYTKMSNISFVEMLKRVKMLYNFVIVELLDTSRFGVFLWVMFGFIIYSFSVLIYKREFKRASLILLPIFQLFFYLSVYLITPFDFRSQFFASFERLFLHLMPTLFFIFISYLDYLQEVHFKV